MKVFFLTALLLSNFVSTNDKARLDEMWTHPVGLRTPASQESKFLSSSPTPDLDLFCADPQKFVCGWNEEDYLKFHKAYPHGNEEAEYQLSLKFLKGYQHGLTREEQEFEKAKTEAFRILANQLNLQPNSFDAKKLEAYLKKLDAQDEDLRGPLLNQYSIIFTRIAKAIVYNRTGKIPETYLSTRKLFEEAKQSISLSILKTVKSERQRTSILRALDKTRLFQPMDFENRPNWVLDPLTGEYRADPNESGSANPAAANFRWVYSKYCSEDIDNPMKSAVYVNEENIVMVCPGFTVAQILSQHSPDASTALVSMLIHEMGHSLEPDQAELNLMNCLEENSLDELGMSDKRKSQAILANQMYEISADQYSIAYLGPKLTSIAEATPAKTIERRLSLLKQTLNAVCDPVIDHHDRHPSTRFRITQIFRRHPKIQEALGCKVKTEKPHFGCSWDGATQERY